MSYSKSVFFIPVWFDDFSGFTKALAQSPLWSELERDRYTPSYLLNYATSIAENKDLFQLFALKDISALNVYMFEPELKLKNTPEIEQVRFSCFLTGVGFMEFWVNYENLTPEEITDFAYLFKKAAKRCGRTLANNKRALYDVATSLLPQNAPAQLFFTASAPFKYECSFFHFLHLDEAPGDSLQTRSRLCRLSHSYHNSFSISLDNDSDMVYKPSENDHWSGSAEGIVNITYDLDPGNADYYLHTIKPSHLSVDYYFLYLLLLNQRFTSIQYIQKISLLYGKSQQEIEQLNKRIIALKTVFSFNVISDDRIFQNVYSKMYRLLEIEHLLADILDNEGQMELLQKASSAKAEKLSSHFLFGISILSLFSAMIDASSYFDRIDYLQPISTILGFACVCATVVLCVIWLIKGRK